MRKKISIVVPIYNVKKYLIRCIDSLITQTYENIEILLVDDGSPDNCGAICDEYATKDSRIKVFHIPNGGVAKARQLGVENSSGEYIIFVDPDDWLPEDAVEVLNSNLDKDIDIVVGSFVKYNTKGILSNVALNDSVITQDDYIEGIIKGTYEWAPWAKIYKRNLFQQDTFHVSKRSQDFLMNLDIACRVNRVKVISKIAYNYYVDLSTLRNKSCFSIHGIVISKMTEILNKFGKKELYEDYINYTALQFLIQGVINGYEIDNNERWVLEAKDYSKRTKLSLRQKVFLKSLDSKFMQSLLFSLYNNPIGLYLRTVKRQL